MTSLLEYEPSKLLCRSPLVSFTVRTELVGEEYQRYVAKYGDTYTHSPVIPSSWLVDKDSSGGSDHALLEWRFHGPESKKDEVVNSVRNFLEGFTYQLH